MNFLSVVPADEPLRRENSRNCIQREQGDSVGRIITDSGAPTSLMGLWSVLGKCLQMWSFSAQNEILPCGLPALFKSKMQHHCVSATLSVLTCLSWSRFFSFVVFSKLLAFQRLYFTLLSLEGNQNKHYLTFSNIFFFCECCLTCQYVFVYVQIKTRKKPDCIFPVRNKINTEFFLSIELLNTEACY